MLRGYTGLRWHITIRSSDYIKEGVLASQEGVLRG